MTRVALLGSGDETASVIAATLDRRPGLECVVLDLSDGPSGVARVMDADVVVYLATSHGRKGLPPGVAATGELCEELAGSGVPRVIVVSSAAIFPARHVHPGLVEESRLPARAVNRVADLWAAFEAQAQERLAALELTILRPAATPTVSGHDHPSRILTAKLAVTCAGHDPSIQLLDVGDLGEAVTCAVERSRGGVFHVAPAGVVPVHKALSLAGAARLPVPRWIQRIGRWALAPLGVASLAEADRIRYSSTVSGRKIRESLGFVPQLGSAEVAARFGAKPPDRELPDFDDFGRDDRYTARLHRTILGFLHDRWWRVELAGLDNVPRAGAAVLTGVHRGFMPFDGSMTILGLLREIGRHPRFLIHPALVKQPFLADFITRQGGVIACRRNADRVLRDGGLLGIYPEGIEGAFTYYREAYRLRRDFGRDEFVKTALRNRAPIVPFVTMGSPEIFPILAKIDWRWWMRFSEWPCFPIAPPLSAPAVAVALRSGTRGSWSPCRFTRSTHRTPLSIARSWRGSVRRFGAGWRPR